MKLRKYQSEATGKILANAAAGIMTNLIVLATGCGKTVVFSHIANERHEQGRVMVIAHRSELVMQAARKLESITNIMPAIEMGDQRSDEFNYYGKPPIVVGSVQTLSAKKCKRLQRFNPHEFSTLVIDECHHATADTWSSVISHFKQNPKCLILGVTATADRADGENLGGLFETLAYEYSLVDAIDDRYLVPILSRTVEIDGLDLSRARTTAGDLNQGDLEACMILEKPLHGIAHAVLEVTTGIPVGSLAPLSESKDIKAEFDRLRNGKKPMRTLVFATSVLHAQRLSEIFNRWMPNCSEAIDGKMTAETRKDTLRRFADNSFQILVNCMIATEGFDAPFIECVAIARPTKSRSLYCQMVGRGTRPAESVAHQLGDMETSEHRKQAVDSSEKPSCLILDFAGNNGRHQLVTTVELVAPAGTDQEIIELAQEICIDGMDAKEAVKEAREEIEKKRREAEERRRQREIEEKERRDAEARKRTNLIQTSSYRIFDPHEEIQRRIRSNNKLERQVNVLIKSKYPESVISKMSDEQIKIYSKEQIRRFKMGLCTYKQAKFLQGQGYGKEFLKNLPMKEATRLIDSIIGPRKRATA